MSVVQRFKEVIGIDDAEHEYRCEACGTTFESNVEPGSYWLECPECEAGTEDLEPV